MTWNGLSLALLVTVAGLLVGCANSFHGSFLVGERWFRANRDTSPVTILSVDGRDHLGSRILVTPGERTVRVQGPSVSGMRGEVRELTLMVEPCFTYYIVAVRPNALARDFTPAVDHMDPLAGCTPPPDWDKK